MSLVFDSNKSLEEIWSGFPSSGVFHIIQLPHLLCVVSATFSASFPIKPWQITAIMIYLLWVHTLSCHLIGINIRQKGLDYIAYCPARPFNRFSTHFIDPEPPGLIKGHFRGLDYTTSITDCSSLLGLHNEISQAGWLKQQKLIFFIILEARSPRSRCW